MSYEPDEDNENKEKERDSIIHISDDDNINYKEIKIYKNIKNLLKILNLMNQMKKIIMKKENKFIEKLWNNENFNVFFKQFK